MSRRIEHKFISGIETKWCFQCRSWLPLKEFCNRSNQWDGLNPVCRGCSYERVISYNKLNKDKVRARQRAYYKKNKIKMAKEKREWRKNNPEKAYEIEKKYRLKNSDEVNKRHKKYRTKNIEKFRKIGVDYRKNNPERVAEQDRAFYRRNKASRRTSKSINRSLRGKKNGRHWEDLVGYTRKDLAKRLKGTMPEGFTWDDFLNSDALHIDHIFPLASFEIIDSDCFDFHRAWALENLQLLPKQDNQFKSASIKNSFNMFMKHFPTERYI